MREIIVSNNDPSVQTVKNNPSSGVEKSPPITPPTIQSTNKSSNQSKSGDSSY